MKFRLIFLPALFLLICCSTVSATNIFVSIAPQKWLVDNLGKELVTTHVLVGDGQDPHTFEPTPRQMTTLAKAKIYFTVDLEFEHHLMRKLQSAIPHLQFIDSAEQVTKIAMESREHNHHAHDETLDPHIWLSPKNLKLMAGIITEALIDSDPENSSSYTDNLSALNLKLDMLDQRLSHELKSFAGQSFYVFHPSFGYFAKDYHLEQKAIEVSGKSPSPKQLSQVITQAKKEGAKVIFVQPQFDGKSAQAIATAIEGEVVPLNPLAMDVIGNLEIMSEKIKKALSR